MILSVIVSCGGSPVTCSITIPSSAKLESQKTTRSPGAKSGPGASAMTASVSAFVHGVVGSALNRSMKSGLAVKSGMPERIASRSTIVATVPLMTSGTNVSKTSSRRRTPSSTSWRIAVPV